MYLSLALLIMSTIRPGHVKPGRAVRAHQYDQHTNPKLILVLALIAGGGLVQARSLSPKAFGTNHPAGAGLSKS